MGVYITRRVVSDSFPSAVRTLNTKAFTPSCNITAFENDPPVSVKTGSSLIVSVVYFCTEPDIVNSGLLVETSMTGEAMVTCGGRTNTWTCHPTYENAARATTDASTTPIPPLGAFCSCIVALPGKRSEIPERIGSPFSVLYKSQSGAASMPYTRASFARYPNTYASGGSFRYSPVSR